MINKHNPTFEFDAYLKADNQTPILCNVALWLPKDAEENVHIEIDSPEQHNIVKNFEGTFVSIESEIYQEKPQFAAVMSKAWIKQISSQLENRKLSCTRIKMLHAWDLSISEGIGNKGVDDNLVETVYFQISNLLYAEPEANRCASYLGSRKAEIEKSYQAKSPTGHTFKIEKHFSAYSKLSQGKEVISSQNVISVTGKNKINTVEIDELIKQANDFVLLLTFAARHQVMVLGYEYWANSKRVRYFRDPLDRYQPKREEIIDDALIPIEHFESFINVALDKWHKFDNDIKSRIKDAIFSIHPFNESGQPDYLSMFSAFEGLINSQKTNIQSELNKCWDDVKKNLNLSIENQNISDEVKSYLKDNLEAVKYSEKFENKTQYILKEQNIHSNDLWPIFGLNSLYKIRNLLAHGNRMELGDYSVAKEHLQYLIERLLLKLLGFDYGLSTVGLNLNKTRFKYSQAEIQDFQKQLKTKNT